MKAATRRRIVKDVAGFCEQYVIGRKLWPAQVELIKAIQTGKKVEVARPGRANARLHMINGRFVVSKPQPRRPRRELMIWTDEFQEDVDTQPANQYNHKHN